MSPSPAARIPPELIERHQWVGWRNEQRRDGPTKVPYSAKTGKAASSTDPSTWAPFELASAYAEKAGLDGVGYVFAHDDPFTGVDLDHCRDPETGSIEPRATDIIKRLASYTETSPSGNGIHILVRAQLPAGRRRQGPIEMYDSGRYFTVTGAHVDGTPVTIMDRKSEIEALHAELFGEIAESRENGHEAPAGGRLADAEILERAGRAANGPKLRALWAGDTAGYASASEADLGLCSLLAFWTQDAGQLDRLFRASGLMRNKWDSQHGVATYAELTIAKALSERHEVYGWGERVSPEPRPAIEQATGLLAFRTACQLCAETPDEPDWAVTGMLAHGAITELSAKVKAGKTTLVLHMVAAILGGAAFLDRATKRTAVLLLTEERPATIRAVLARCGLSDRNDLHILTLSDMRGRQWPEIVMLAETYAATVGATVLIVDTLARWAGLADDSENSAGAAASAMEPLEQVAARGMAALVLRHDRKSGGEIGESGRGSSAFAGAADILLSLRRATVEGHLTRRLLEGVGRFENVPDKLVLELQDGRYVVVGDAIDVERTEAIARITSVLEAADEPLIEADILTKLPGVKRSTWQRARNHMLAAGELAKLSGHGRGGKAFAYRLLTHCPAPAPLGSESNQPPFPETGLDTESDSESHSLPNTDVTLGTSVRLGVSGHSDAESHCPDPNLLLGSESLAGVADEGEL